MNKLTNYFQSRYPTSFDILEKYLTTNFADEKKDLLSKISIAFPNNYSILLLLFISEYSNELRKPLFNAIKRYFLTSLQNSIWARNNRVSSWNVTCHILNILRRRPQSNAFNGTHQTVRPNFLSNVSDQFCVCLRRDNCQLHLKTNRIPWLTTLFKQLRYIQSTQRFNNCN